MGPQTKKRKLQSTAEPTSKRSKGPPVTKKPKAKAVKAKPRRTIDADSLAWKSVDEDEFGCLQIIENVEIARNGNAVQFLVSEDQKANGTKNDEGESFEGFGDDTVESADVDSGEAGSAETGLATAQPQEQPQAEDDAAADKTIKEQQSKKQKKQKQQRADTQLAKNAGLQKSSAQGNSFEALAREDEAHDDDDNGGDVDVAEWAALSLSPQMLTAVAKLKFKKPTEIQRQTIPEILAGDDVVGKAQTGSGKTLAFGIPIIEKWLEANDEKEQDGENAEDAEEKKSHSPTAVILSPTRELAKQIGEHLKALCSGLTTTPYICVVTGGLSIQKQQRQLARADIVVATPGRLWEVLEGDAKLQDSFTEIRFLVVDEADRLFKAGQFKEVEDILGALDRRDPEAEEDEEDEDEDDLPPRQTLVFSATFDKDLQTKLAGRGKSRNKGSADEENQMAYLMKSLKFRQEPKFVDVNPVRQMAVGLREGLVECGAMEKDLYLYTVLLLNPNRRTLVFTNSISAVRRLTPFLSNLSVTAHPLHSQMPQKARLRSLERFTEGNSGKPGGSVLVATDVAARGLDIPEVDMVLHYHVPRAADAYVHRSGRTARGERSGVSVMLCAPEEVVPTRRLAGKVHAEASSKDSKTTGRQHREHMIQTLPIDRKIASRLKPRTDLAKRLADAALAKEKAISDDTFMRSAAEDLGVDYDSEEAEQQELAWGGRGGGRRKKEKVAREVSKAEMRAMRAQLRAELSKRVNLGVSERYITGGRVDVAALLREREQGMGAGVFLGAEGMGLGFDL